MRHLTYEVTGLCCPSPTASLPIGAAFRNGTGRKPISLSFLTRKPIHSACSISSNASHARYCDGDQGGGRGNGGYPPGTGCSDADDSQPSGRYRLLGVAISLACASALCHNIAEEHEAASCPTQPCKSADQADLPPQSSLSLASKLEDTSELEQQLSVCEAFAGRTVLLTGVTGFVGSLVLEQLLRTCPDVRKVFVIARQKQATQGPERVRHLLHHHPLFHLVRAKFVICSVTGSISTGTAPKEALRDDSSNQLQSECCCVPEIEVLTGDMTLPDYGIGHADMHRLQQETDIVIHAAASISFDDHIHDALKNNYVATKYLADMAAGMPKLKAFVHVSTAYVNGNQPKGSAVAERMLPLADANEDHTAIVSKLQALSKAQAASQADKYMRQWRFPNTYCFTKRLAESLMASYQVPSFPVAIVRPSIIGGLAGTPLPGYVGNTAGSTGASLAIATGIAAWTCHQPGSVFDVVPGDLVSSAILAAAAATVQGVKTQQQPLILHACTSSQNPLMTGQFFQHIQEYFTSHPPPLKVILGPYPKYQGLNIVSNRQALLVRSALAEAKFATIGAALRAFGQDRLAKKLVIGWKAWQKYNTPQLDFDLRFETHNLRQLRRLTPSNEKSLFRLSWEGQDWRRYMTTYMAGIRHSVFKLTTFADAAQHDFRPWPLTARASASSSAAVKAADA